MRIKNFGKKIVLSVAASLVLSGNVNADSQTNIINSVIQESRESNKKIDTSKYGELSKYKIGGVSLEDFVQTKNTVNKKVKFINNAIKNLPNLKTTKRQDEKVQDFTSSASASIKEYKNIEVENSRNPFIDNAIGAYDAIKTAPTLAKYGAKFLTPGVSTAYNKAKKVINTIDKVNGATEMLAMSGALLKIMEPFVTKSISSMDGGDTAKMLKGLADIKISLEKLLISNKSKTALGSKGLTTVYSLLKSVDNGLVGDKIQKNINNMVNDGLMNTNTASLVKAKLSNDAIMNAANTFIKSIEVLSMLGIKNEITDMAAGIVGDMKNISEVFIKGSNRINEQAFKDIYDGRKKQKEALIFISTDILQTANIIKHDQPKIDKNKNTLTKLKIKNKKLNDKLFAIKDKQQVLKDNKSNLSDIKRQLNDNERVMKVNKLTKKEKLLIMAQKILYSGGNKGVSPLIAWKNLSKTKKNQLAGIYKSLGFDYDKGNVSSISVLMANYIGKNNHTINALKNKKARYLNASSWNEGIKYTYSSIAKTIINLTNEIELLNDDIAPLEKAIASLMNQIVDTSDYNNNQKNDLAQNTDSTQSSDVTIPLTGYIDASKSSLSTSVRSGIVVTESSGNLDTLSLGVGSKPLLNTGTFTKKPDNDYSYISWGTWSSSNVKYYYGDNQVYDLGATNNVVYYGKRTATNDIPTIGSAVYNGEAIGYIKSSNTAVNGTVQILANFADNSISGSININSFANTNINGQIGGIYTGDSAAYSKTIDGSLSGTNVASGSTMNAQFYGSGAAEMGGIWKIKRTDNEEASGVFRAKK